MICKWCGATVQSGEKKCRNCGKEAPTLGACGGFSEPTPAMRVNEPVRPQPQRRDPLRKAGNLEAVASKSSSKKSGGSIVPVLAIVLCVLLVLLFVSQMFLRSRVKDLEKDLKQFKANISSDIKDNKKDETPEIESIDPVDTEPSSESIEPTEENTESTTEPNADDPSNGDEGQTNPDDPSGGDHDPTEREKWEKQLIQGSNELTFVLEPDANVFESFPNAVVEINHNEVGQRIEHIRWYLDETQEITFTVDFTYPEKEGDDLNVELDFSNQGFGEYEGYDYSWSAIVNGEEVPLNESLFSENSKKCTVNAKDLWEKLGIEEDNIHLTLKVTRENKEGGALTVIIKNITLTRDDT